MDLKKRLRIEQRIDRISELPDEVLGKILSYLPLKDIVATSILSTKWKPLSPSSVSLVKLDFDYSHRPPNLQEDDSFDPFPDFCRFVETVVLNFKDPRHGNIIDSWIAAFVRHNLQSLRIFTMLCGSKSWFDGLHGCSTLVELELEEGLDLHVSEEVFLPNHKKLSLVEVIFSPSDNTIGKLLHACPMLNDLRITKCGIIGEAIHIQHPNIIKLFMDGMGCHAVVVIDAPSLEVIVLKLHGVSYVLKNPKSLHSACLDFFCDSQHDHDRMTELVQALSSTTRISLSSNLLQCLYCLSVRLPTFRNLTCLALGRMGGFPGWKMLARFLESAPKLAILTFEEEIGFKYSDTDFKSSLPVSLILNIKKIEIRKFNWTRDQMKLIEYFLKEGRLLQELIVHCLPCGDKRGLKILSMLPRYSEACQVLFKDKNNWVKSCENWF